MSKGSQKCGPASALLIWHKSLQIREITDLWCVFHFNVPFLLNECWAKIMVNWWIKISGIPAPASDCLFVEHRRAGGHLQYPGIPWDTLCGANVIRINRGWPQLMRINAGSDVSPCPSPIKHAYQPFIDCFEWAQLLVCVLCSLCEHLLHCHENQGMRRKIDENWISLFAGAWAFLEGNDWKWTTCVEMGNQKNQLFSCQPHKSLQWALRVERHQML